MKTERGNFRMLRKEQRMPQTEDSYRMAGKLPDPARCPKCEATYRKGRWTWGKAPEDAAHHTCPACQRIADGFPAGYVTLGGSFLQQHRTEVLNLVTAREARAKSDHPLQRIMAVETVPEGVLVTTTDAHLARVIAHSLHQAFKGDLKMSFRKAGNLLRATWNR